MILVELNDSITMFFAVIIPVIVIALTVVLFFVNIKEHKKQAEEKDNFIEGALSKTELFSSVGTYISRSPDVEFSLLYVDLDKFGNVFETLGKRNCNIIVKDLCKKIMNNLPNRVEFSRTSDDEFVIFLKGDYSKNEVTTIAKNIIKLVNEPIKLFGDETVTLTCSVGIAFYPLHGSTVKQLKESLNIAMYLCKREGGNKFKIYSHDNSDVESENLKYYEQIKDGIKNNEFSLYFQPMVDYKEKKIFGIEGLLRWNHPELGILSPYKFINIMEQSGDIYWVGLWGLETLIKQYLELVKIASHEEFVMSLNLSPKQLSDPTLPTEFSKILKKYNIRRSCIVLEIEEFALYEKHDIIKNNIKALINLGFIIAVDGFGLDYEAIKHLESMDINIVKLDKQYLDTETDEFLKQRFINLLVEYSQRTNKIIVGEGIETEDDLNQACKFGLTKFQGYYFGKPMDSKQIVQFLIDYDNKNLNR